MSEIKEMPLVELTAKDLPAYCPNPSMPRWSNHPRVFIDVTHGEARCPYCSTRYKLRAGEVVKGHCAPSLRLLQRLRRHASRGKLKFPPRAPI